VGSDWAGVTASPGLSFRLTITPSSGWFGFDERRLNFRNTVHTLKILEQIGLFYHSPGFPRNEWLGAP